MPPFLLHLIRDLHTGTILPGFALQMVCRMRSVHVNIRGCQGCILAPALFCCAIDWLLQQCSGSF